MARISSNFSCNPLPAFCPAKPVSHLLFSVRFVGNPVRWANARQTKKLAMVVRYRGGRFQRGSDFDEEETWPQEEEDEEEREYDPNLDIDRIETPTVRLLDEQQNMLGVMPLTDAIKRAENTDLMLAVVSIDADPPVLRLFGQEDYRRHMFEKQKKKKVQQRKSGGRVKELKMGYNIEAHDYSVKLKQGKKFLKEGDKVKVIVNLKGRQNQYKNDAIELIKRFKEDLGQLATEESKNFTESNMYMVLTPNKANIQREEQLKKNEQKPVTEVSANV